MPNTAQSVIIPDKPSIFRIVFLYVGQGDTTLLVIPDGPNYKYALVDSNHSETNDGGIDLPTLLKDLFYKNGKLDLYINTHPHKDHLDIIEKIHDDIGIKELWHSGHKAGGEHKQVYEELQSVIKKMGSDKVFQLLGSQEENKIDNEIKKLGDINFNILAPAQHVCDDIDDEDSDARYQRIHEQCGVLRFKYGANEKQVLVVGDADYTAWKEHITEYHRDRLPSTVLRSAHHGSKSFFWEGDPEGNDPYTEHLDSIDPSYIIISAPKSSESRHCHPHEEAMSLYEEKVGGESVFHLGKNRECVIVDIFSDGNLDIRTDKELVTSYGGGDKSAEKQSKQNNVTYQKPRSSAVTFPNRYG